MLCQKKESPIPSPVEQGTDLAGEGDEHLEFRPFVMKKSYPRTLLLVKERASRSRNGLDIDLNLMIGLRLRRPSTPSGYSGETGHSFRFKTATDRSEATLDSHYTSLWPE